MGVCCSDLGTLHFVNLGLGFRFRFGARVRAGG